MSASRDGSVVGDARVREERRAALRDLLPAVERLRGVRAVVWAGGDRNENGSINIRYPIYDRDTEKVMEVCNGGALTDVEYRRTLERRGGHGMGSQAPDLVALARDSDEELTVALLTWMMRSERFSEGEVAASLENGALVALLDRLRDLYVL
ncbi:DUF6508 domain-containing protein [Dietzia cercidiphylli]|uniref:DUF6508 domain-containing protein n=1 Tax=Dietzia cercidiphylli TaxID=498199 RepID=UPI00223A6E6D|nr:DUF6508 domain-containing protein [Dietzia cercidiphylli]MCT1516541.1 DUF6508 domain-containing protein [Dietzia cercidiphylli]